MHTIYLVSCVSKKQMESCKARDMYQSDWFKKARAFVEPTGMPWYILSAKYGLVSPDDTIAPYEQSLNTMAIGDRHAWADQVMEGLNPLVSKDDAVVILAGGRYREFIVPRLQRLAAKVSVPMEGMRIGEQLSWLGKFHGQN